MIKILEGTVRRGGFRLYRNTGDRRRAVTNLKKQGYNYFVGFKDNNPTHPAGLDYGSADWAGLFPYERDIAGRTIIH